MEALQPLGDPGAEAGLIGAIIIGLDASTDLLVESISSGLCLDDLFVEKHRVLFKGALELHREGKEIDEGSLSMKLSETGELDAVDGIPGIMQVSDQAYAPMTAREALRQVLEKAKLRKLNRAARILREKLYEPGASSGDLIAGLETEVRKIAERSGPMSEFISMAEIARENEERLGARLAGESGDTVSIPTHLPSLNGILPSGGFAGGSLVVLAARPGDGKTALAMNFLEHAAKHSGYHSLLFSLEMEPAQLGDRTAAGLSSVSAKAISDGNLSGQQIDIVNQAYREMTGMKASVVKTKRLTVHDIRAKSLAFKSRLERRDEALGMVLIDYLQLIQPTDRKMPREQQVAEISRELKTLALELRVPIILLAQINRESEKTGREPRKSDLRESGAIEQDADVILLLHRCQERQNLLGDPTSRSVKLIIDKNRSGPDQRFVMLKFQKPTMRFTQA